MNTRTVTLITFYLLVPRACLSQEPEILNIQKVGVRNLEYGKRTYSFPWYHVKADHNQIRSDKAWSRIPAAPGSKTAHIGSYGSIELIEFSEEGHSTMHAEGLSLFYTNENRRLKIGPGKVYVRHFYFDDPIRDQPMGFRNADRSYVVCLNREPVSTFKNMKGEPGCDLDTELEHLVGVIEVEHTYDWRELPDWDFASINDETLVSFRTNRNGFASPDVMVEKREANNHQVSNRDGSAIGGDDVINRLVYGLRSCNWRKRKTQYRFRRSPPVTETQIVLKNGGGPKNTLVISYDDGAWILNVNDKQYQSAHPTPIFDVHLMVQELVARKK